MIPPVLRHSHHSPTPLECSLSQPCERCVQLSRSRHSPRSGDDSGTWTGTSRDGAWIEQDGGHQPWRGIDLSPSDGDPVAASRTFHSQATDNPTNSGLFAQKLKSLRDKDGFTTVLFSCHVRKVRGQGLGWGDRDGWGQRLGWGTEARERQGWMEAGGNNSSGASKLFPNSCNQLDKDPGKVVPASPTKAPLSVQ